MRSGKPDAPEPAAWRYGLFDNRMSVLADRDDTGAHVSLWLRAPDAGSRSTVGQRKAAL